MRSSRFVSYSVLFATSLFVASINCVANADTVLSTYGNHSNDFIVDYWDWVGNSFNTDNNSWTLNSVRLNMGAVAGTPPGTFFVQIWSDASSTHTPGSLIETLSGTNNPSTVSDYNYTSGGITLLPATTYWLVAGVSTQSDWGWYNWRYYSDSGTFTTTGSWSISPTATVAYSFNEAQSWTHHAGMAQIFSIDATAASSPVPEIDPAGMGSVLALVTGALGVLERRRQKVA